LWVYQAATHSALPTSPKLAMTENSFRPDPLTSSDGQRSPTQATGVVITDTDAETHHCVKHWLSIVQKDGMYAAISSKYFGHVVGGHTRIT
jgi:hypothetical protein